MTVCASSVSDSNDMPPAPAPEDEGEGEVTEAEERRKNTRAFSTGRVKAVVERASVRAERRDRREKEPEDLEEEDVDRRESRDGEVGEVGAAESRRLRSGGEAGEDWTACQSWRRPAWWWVRLPKRQSTSMALLKAR